MDLETLSLEASQGLIDFLSRKYKDLIETITQNSDRSPDLNVIDNFVYKKTYFADGNPDHEDHSRKLWIPDE